MQQDHSHSSSNRPLERLPAGPSGPPSCTVSAQTVYQPPIVLGSSKGVPPETKAYIDHQVSQLSNEFAQIKPDRQQLEHLTRWAQQASFNALLVQHLQGAGTSTVPGSSSSSVPPPPTRAPPPPPPPHSPPRPAGPSPAEREVEQLKQELQEAHQQFDQRLQEVREDAAVSEAQLTERMQGQLREERSRADQAEHTSRELEFQFTRRQSEMEAQAHQAERTAREQEAQLTRRQSELEAQARTARDREAQLTRRQSELETQVRVSESKCTELNGALAEAKAELRRVEERQRQLMSSIDQKQQDNARLRQEMDRLKSTHAALQTNHSQLEQSHAQLQQTNRQLTSAVTRAQQNTAMANLSSEFPIDSEIKAMYETFLEEAVVNLWLDLQQQLALHFHLHPVREINAAKVIYAVLQSAHHVLTHHFNEHFAKVRDATDALQGDFFKSHHVTMYPEQLLFQASMQAAYHTLNIRDPAACPALGSLERMIKEFLAIAWKIALLKPESLRLVFENHEMTTYNSANHIVQAGTGPQVYFLAPRLDHIQFDPVVSPNPTPGVYVRAYVVLGTQAMDRLPGSHY